MDTWLTWRVFSNLTQSISYKTLKQAPSRSCLGAWGNLPLMWDKSLRNMSPPDNEKKKAQKPGTTVTLQTQAVQRPILQRSSLFPSRCLWNASVGGRPALSLNGGTAMTVQEFHASYSVCGPDWEQEGILFTWHTLLVLQQARVAGGAVGSASTCWAQPNWGCSSSTYPGTRARVSPPRRPACSARAVCPLSLRQSLQRPGLRPRKPRPAPVRGTLHIRVPTASNATAAA